MRLSLPSKNQLFRWLLIPRKIQWKNWSLPSKHTAIGVYVGIPLTVIGILLSVIFFYLSNIDIDDLAKKLAERMPVQQSLIAKEDKIQNLKATLERLQNKSDDPLTKQMFDALVEGDVVRALELMEKTASASQDWIDIGNIAYLYDPKKALAAYKKAVALAPSNPAGWNRLGQMLGRTGYLKEAEKAFKQVLELSGTDESIQAIAYGNLGNVYQIRGDLDKAEEFCRKALKLNEGLDNKERMAEQYNNLGIIYRYREQLDQAETFYRKALELYNTIDNKEGVAEQYNNLGIIYRMNGDLPKAEKYFQDALKISAPSKKSLLIAGINDSLGSLYQKRGKYKKAEDSFMKSLAICETLGEKEYQATVYDNLANLYNEMACTTWQKSLELFSEIEAKTKVQKVSTSLNNTCNSE